MGINNKILKKVLSGLSDKNIRFSDLRKLLLDLRFEERVRGGHHIFYHLQPLSNGKAKPYQVKQIRNILLKYKLHKEA